MLHNFQIGLVFIIALFSAKLHALTPAQMISHILEVGEEVVQAGNVVEFSYKGLPLMLVFDENADRMRLVSPIASMEEVGDDLVMMAMEANFHSALDARYAISNDTMWSAYIHPLKDLTLAQFDSAITQVAIARATFGSEFTSGILVFPSRSQ